ncbi:hypothetical protein BH11ACT8_BH11ACT8_11710 [soil metagenome]
MGGVVVFRPGPAARWKGVTAGVPLLVLFVLLVPWTRGASLLLAVLPLFAASELWRRATVTERDLVVQGRLSRRRVALVDLDQVHLDMTRRVWVAPRDQQAFRILLIPLGEGTVKEPGAVDFVGLVRARAHAVGASVRVDASLMAQPVEGTSRFFSA